MSENDSEISLKDMVMQVINENGILAEIKAKLRASVAQAVGEETKFEGGNNSKLKSYLKSNDGQVMFGLVREFLEFFDMKSTLLVFDADSRSGEYYRCENREEMAQKLNLNDLVEVPLLQQFAGLNRIKTVPVITISHVETNGNVSDGI